MAKQKGNTERIVFSEVAQELIGLLDSSSVKKCNIRLLKDAASVTIKAVSACSSIHAARKRMKQGKSRRQIARVLEGLELATLENEINGRLKTNSKPLRNGNWTVAIDTHLIAYHGQKHQTNDEISRSKQKDGTTHFHTIATAYVVDSYGRRWTIAAIFVRKGTSMRSIVQQLISLIRKCKINIKLLLLDRGFYAINVIILLMRWDIPFIMPMKGKGLPKKRGSYGSLYTMKSIVDGKIRTLVVQAISVVKYNRGKRFGHKGSVHWCYIIYKVNRPYRDIANLYRRRFGIECSYKLNKSRRPRSSTRNPAIRLFLFAASAFLQNRWISVKRMFCKRVTKASPEMITLKDFADIMLSVIRRAYGEITEFVVVPR